VFALVVLGLVSSVQCQEIGWENVSEMTHFVSSGTQKNLNSVNPMQRFCRVRHPMNSIKTQKAQMMALHLHS